MLDKAFAAGIGLLHLSLEKAELFFDELVERGTITREEARSTLDDLIVRGEEQRQEWQEILDQEMERLRGEFRRVSHQEFAELKERVAALEKRWEASETDQNES